MDAEDVDAIGFVRPAHPRVMNMERCLESIDERNDFSWLNSLHCLD